MRLLGLLILAGTCLAQDNSLLTVVRGTLLEFGTAATGEVTVRKADFQVERCLYDTHTYFESSNHAIASAGLRSGTEVEIVSDRNGNPNRCFARTVRVVETTLPHSRLLTAPLPELPSFYSSSLDSIIPRGNLTYAGVILRISPDSLVLHTRSDGQKSITLRQDTRYLQGGSPVAQSKLQVNDRVFVRAGKNFDDQIEAYQVVWGEILLPRE